MRITIPGARAIFPALLCSLCLFVLPAHAQYSPGPPLICTSTASATPTIRAEGLSEKAGDVVFVCTGGTPTPIGQPVPQMHLTVYLNANLTSRVTQPQVFSEALLLMDEPHSPSNPSTPFLVCDPENASLGICSIQGSGNGVGTYDGSSGRPNVFQARRTGHNQVTFFSVPFDPPGAQKTRTLRVTNLRVNAKQLGVSASLLPAQVVAAISVSPPNLMPLDTPVRIVAFSVPGVAASLPSSAVAQSCVSANPAIAADPSKPLESGGQNGQQFTVRIEEGFPSAWSERNVAVHLANSAGPPSPAYPADQAQDVSWASYFSESGFLVNGVSPSQLGYPAPGWGPYLTAAAAFPDVRGLPQAGVADAGTRPMIRLSGIPDGVRIYVPSRLNLEVTDSPGTFSGVAILTAGDASGSGPFSPQTGNSAGLVPLQVTGGTATAVYEVLLADPFYNERISVPVAVAYVSDAGADIPAFSTIAAQAGLGPFSSEEYAVHGAPLPRFGEPSNLGTAMVIQACQPVLSASVTHNGNFRRAQTGALYTIVVTNAAEAPPTSGSVTVTETLPPGMTLVSMSGAGWNCTGAACTRSDVLNAGASYPPITVAVNVAADAGSPLLNNVTLSGGGSATRAVTDSTVVEPATGTVNSLALSADVLRFTTETQIGTNPQILEVVSGIPRTFTVHASSDGNWLSVIGTTPLGNGVWQATTPKSVSVLVDPSGLGAGDYSGWIVINSNEADNTPLAISVFLRVVKAALMITKSHAGNFRRGQTGAIYTVTVSNALGAAPSHGAVAVVDSAPPGLTIQSMSGAGWNCTLNGCTRNDSLNPGAAYPPITVAVNVASDAAAQVINTATVTGGGSATAQAADTTRIVTAPPVLRITKTHAGDFTQGQSGAYTIAVSNDPAAGPTSGTVTVSDSVPAGMTLTSMSGAGWTCAGNTCTHAGVLLPGASYPNLTATVDVAANAAATLVNVAQVSGGGSEPAQATDPTTILPGSGAPRLRFVAIAPCRIADTRSATGPFGGPALAAGAVRNFDIPAGSCGIPRAAAAYALNVTVVPPGPLGYITVWPAGQPQPISSTLNSHDGRIKANAAVVAAGTGNAVSVFATETTHVVLDINGYFVPASDGSALAFYPVPPCRVVDTRTPNGAFGSPSMSAGTTRSFPVLSSACNIPVAARAYSLNVTVVPAGPFSYLTAWPAGQTRPAVSTLNAPTGAVTANAAIVPAGNGGAIEAYVTEDTELVIDINGYFAPATAAGLSLYGMAPCRVLDTRQPSGSPAREDRIDIPVTASECAAPAAAQAYVFNATVVPPGPLGFLTLWPGGAAAMPVVSTLNAPDAMVTSNLAIVPAGNGAISAFQSNLGHLVLDLFGYFAP